MFRDIHVPNGVVLAVAVVALVASSVAIGAAVFGRSAPGSAGMMGGTNGAGMMGGTNGAGMMGGTNGAGMMGGTNGAGMMGGTNAAGLMGGTGAMDGPQPGTAGFVPGTASAPRLIRIYAGPGYTFSPSTIAVARGEAVTFDVTTMGPLVHEFMVGPADAVAADQHGTPEIAAIGMMQTRSLPSAFAGAAPYAFACHADGHYEAGMHGTITVVG